jgi:hypothetical protein
MKKIILAIILIIVINIGLSIYKNIDKKLAQSHLNSFYNLTLQDPLFYSPFFEKDEFENAIERLRKSEDQLRDVYIKNYKTFGNAEWRKVNYFITILKKNTLFPYQFLRNLISINQKTEEFLKYPSLKLGQELLKLYDDAADAYIQDASLKIKILEEEKDDCYLLFVDSVSSCKVAKNDMLTIRENGYKLKEEIKKRKMCILGKASCETPNVKENMSFTALMESMRSGEFNLKGEKIDFIKNRSLSFPDLSEVRGPYKIKSYCWQNPNFEQWFYLIAYAKQNGVTSVLPKLANQNYYWEINTDIHASKLDKALLEKGVKFHFQPEATTYECMDLTFYPELLTLDFISKQIESGLITKKDLEEKIDYKLLMENQFGLISPAINTISDHLRVFEMYMVINETISDPSFLFPIRTAYSIFSFPYAKSVWRIDKQLQYFVPDKEKPIIRMSKSINTITLDELRKLDYTIAQINKFHINGSAFFKSLE